MSLAEEIAALPLEMQQEVADFVGYLRQKRRRDPSEAVSCSLKAAAAFHGLGAEIWQDVDPDQYVAELRADVNGAKPTTPTRYRQR